MKAPNIAINERAFHALELKTASDFAPVISDVMSHDMNSVELIIKLSKVGAAAYFTIYA